MTRTVYCKKFSREMPGLEAPPFPGPAGQDVYDNISAEAWRGWQELQTMLINEHQLAATDKESRQWLAEQRNKYFANADYAKPAGYVPPQ